MQFKKTDVKEAILQAAREEFLAKGFKDASIRTITKNAGVARSNLYNYFANKDTLFTAVVQPTLAEIKHAVKLAWRLMPSDGKGIPTLEHEIAEGRAVVDFIDAHREDLTLILLKADGSSVEQFQESVQEEYQKMYTCYFEYIKTHFPEKMKNEVSPFFIHALTSLMFNFIVEVVAHEIPRDEMFEYMEQIARFYYYGQFGVMEH